MPVLFCLGLCTFLVHSFQMPRGECVPGYWLTSVEDCCEWGCAGVTLAPALPARGVCVVECALLTTAAAGCN